MTGTYTRPLGDLRGSDEPSFGGKSAGLGELLGAGITVPPGFALSTSALDRHLREGGLEPLVERELAGLDSGRLDSVQRASAAIGEAIGTAPLADALADELAQRYAELGARIDSDAPPVAVRSSAIGEDSRDATFAGQQATRLWVRGVHDLHVALRECWASLYSAPAITYRAKLGDGGPLAMGVAVQLMVDAAVSGVMFTCNPVSGDPSMVSINASWGLGSAVVEGEVTPDDYMLSKVTGEIVRERVSHKARQCVPRADGRGTELVAVARAAARPALSRRSTAVRAGGALRPGAAPLRLPSGHRVGDRTCGRVARRRVGDAVAPGHHARQAPAGAATISDVTRDEYLRRPAAGARGGVLGGAQP